MFVYKRYELISANCTTIRDMNTSLNLKGTRENSMITEPEVQFRVAAQGL